MSNIEVMLRGTEIRFHSWKIRPRPIHSWVRRPVAIIYSNRYSRYGHTVKTLALSPIAEQKGGTVRRGVHWTTWLKFNMAAVFGRAVALLSFVSISLSLSLAAAGLDVINFVSPSSADPSNRRYDTLIHSETKRKRCARIHSCLDPSSFYPSARRWYHSFMVFFVPLSVDRRNLKLKSLFSSFFLFFNFDSIGISVCVRCAHGRPEREMSKKLGYVRSPNGRFLPGDNRRLPRGEPVFLYLL